MANFFEEVYKQVKEVPRGKVVTYGQVAAKIGTRDARKIGWALHANDDPKTPCHRVVTKEGRVSESYSFGGADLQREKLEEEGVGFKDKTHVLPEFILKSF